MLNRLAIASFSAVLALSTYACGDDDDDDTGETPDAAADDGSGDPDAGSDVDAAVGPRDPAITDFEGGQLLVEYITLDEDLRAAYSLPEGVNSVARFMGYFVGDQTPQSNPLPAVSADETCVNLYDTDGWPLGPYDGQDRAELDVGEVTVTGLNSAGDEVSTVVTRTEDSADNWQRGHDLFYQNIPPDAANYLAPDTTYTVEMSGSADYPAATYEDVIYIAGEYELGISPALNDEDIGLSTTADTLITWTQPKTPNQNQPDNLFGGLLTVIVLGDANTGAPVMLCPVPASNEEFLITAEQVASFRASVEARNGKGSAERAILLRNNFSHIMGWVNNGTDGAPYDPANARRIDFLGVQCAAQLVNSPE